MINMVVLVALMPRFSVSQAALTSSEDLSAYEPKTEGSVPDFDSL
jgi:hypothetical protein